HRARLKAGKHGAQLASDQVAGTHAAHARRRSHSGTAVHTHAVGHSAALGDVLHLEVLAKLNLVASFGVGVTLFVRGAAADTLDGYRLRWRRSILHYHGSRDVQHLPLLRLRVRKSRSRLGK